MPKFKLEAAQRLTAAPKTQAMKAVTQALIDESATARFTADVAELRNADAEKPVICIDLMTAKAVVALLSRHEGAHVEIRATGPGKAELDFVSTEEE